jgi:riboflavin biosynthesis pyrimidine reductase
MKPYIVCHMTTSLDGRILPDRWSPQNPCGEVYDRLHNELAGQAWIVGRTTGAEFAKAEAYPQETDEAFPREPWFAVRDAQAYGIVLDAHGKIAWGRSDIGGDPIVVVLTEAVSDSCLAGLRADGVSYIFAGKDQLDIPAALSILRAELGIERLILEGGGVTNGEFLRAGLVDELSLIVWPAIDGAAGAPSLFDSAREGAGVPPVGAIKLMACERLEDDAIWLRYQIKPT